MKNQIFLFSLLFATFISCSREEIDSINMGIEKDSINTFMVLKDVTNALSNVSVQSLFDIASDVHENGDIFETEYFKDIYSINTKANESAFGSLSDEILSNISSYSAVRNYLRMETKSDTPSLLAELPVEVYFPNHNSFIPQEENEITIACANDYTEDWTDGYKYTRNGEKIYVPYIDGAYLACNMTILILPKDTTDYTLPLSEDEIQNRMNNYKATKSSDIANGKLTTNITNSGMIDDGDILYTTIAAIRVNGTSWCGAISNKLKLALYRASGDIEFNADGSLKPSGSCHKPFVLAISKDKLEANEWVTGAFVFDDDWDLHEYDQKIYFASEHNTGSTSAKVTANVGIGYKDGKPSVDLGATANVDVTFATHSKLRQHNQFSRRGELANIVTDLGAGLYQGQSIKSYGIVEVVYNYYYTDYE